MAIDVDAALRSNDSSIVVMKSREAEELAKHVQISLRAQVDLEGRDDIAAFVASRLLPRHTGSKKAA